VPTAPSSLTASMNDDNTVSLSWTDNSSNEDYFIVQRENGSGTWINIGQYSANNATATDNSIDASGSYTYQVKAVNTGGSSQWSNQASVSVTLMEDTTTNGGSGNEPGTVLFEDNFDDGNDDGWSVGSGSWSVDNGEYVKSGTSGEGRSVAGDVSWTDYVVDVKMMLTEGSRDAGVIARYVDDKNFYFMEVKAGAFKIQRRKSGSWSTIIESVPDPLIEHNVWMDLRFEVRGDTLRHYVNGELKLEGIDSSFPQGKIGLRSYEQAMRYDNLVVRALDGETGITANSYAPRKNYTTPPPHSLTKSMGENGHMLFLLNGRAGSLQALNRSHLGIIRQSNDKVIKHITIIK